MAVSSLVAPSAASKTMYRTTLTSGTSYTVPAGVTYLNVTLYGGGGGGSGSNGGGTVLGQPGLGGQIISSTLAATAGSSIAYAIGAGGTGGNSNGTNTGGTGGTTTFTGATSAVGGNGGSGLNTNNPTVGTTGASASNGGSSAGANYSIAGATGGSGKIDIEYWA